MSFLRRAQQILEDFHPFHEFYQIPNLERKSKDKYYKLNKNRDPVCILSSVGRGKALVGSHCLMGPLRMAFQYPCYFKNFIRNIIGLIHSAQMLCCITDTKSNSFLKWVFFGRGKQQQLAFFFLSTKLNINTCFKKTKQNKKSLTENMPEVFQAASFHFLPLAM